MTHELLGQLFIIGGVSVLAAIVLGRLKLPILTVLLLAGALVGPHGLGLLGDARGLQTVAEIGVVLLLFTIGLEFSLARLGRIGRLVALGGTLQMGLTIGAVVGVAMSLGWSIERGIFHGFLAALSSTAIVLRALSERGELDAPHGHFIVGVLILQDLAVVPMMLLVPILAGEGGAGALDALVALGKAAVLVVVVVGLARLLVPRLFHLVDRARSREVFLLSVLVVCVGTAWLSSLAGLSVALGAFLAGVVLADTDYAHRALADILPLRDVLASVFFMSLGTLFDFRVLYEQPATVGFLFLALFVGKAVIAAIAALAMGLPVRVAVLAGLGLAQFGEFGFVLAQQGQPLGLIVAAEVRPLLAAAILTMLVTPVAVRVAPRIASTAGRLRALNRLLGMRGIEEPAPQHERISGHVLVVGFGVAGQELAHALRRSGVPYLVLELNAATVRAARARGEPVYYADVGSPEALIHARLAQARALVLLINDPYSAERAIAAARRLSPTLPIFMRTHYVRDAPRLVRLGATEVIVEEIEAGLAMLARVLSQLGTSSEEARKQEADARAEMNQLFRGS
ncbi:MAG: cation:proton antiporter [Myxococcota bacterium]